MALERELLHKAQLVIVLAERLFSRSAAKTRARFWCATVSTTPTSRRRSRPRPASRRARAVAPAIIGYFGLMAADWIDIDLMVKVAKRFSDGSLVLLGKVTTDVSALSALPNVHLLGRKPYTDLPAYSKGFDVAILPFPISEVTLTRTRSRCASTWPRGAGGLDGDTGGRGAGDVPDRARPRRLHRRARGGADRPGPKPERSALVKNESWDARVETIRGHVAALG